MWGPQIKDPQNPLVFSMPMRHRVTSFGWMLGAPSNLKNVHPFIHQSGQITIIPKPDLNPSKIKQDLTNGPLGKVQELWDTQV